MTDARTLPRKSYETEAHPTPRAPQEVKRNEGPEKVTENERRDLWLKFSGGALCGVLSAPEGTLGEKPVAATLAAEVADQMVEEYASRFGHLHSREAKPRAAAPNEASIPRAASVPRSGFSADASESPSRASAAAPSRVIPLPTGRTSPRK